MNTTKKMLRSMLAMFMVVLMIVSLVPAAFADGEEAESAEIWALLAQSEASYESNSYVEPTPTPKPTQTPAPKPTAAPVAAAPVEAAVAEEAAVVETEAAAEEAAVVETEAAAEEAAVVETEAVAEEAAVVETEAVAEEAAVVETEAVAEEAAVVETEAAAEEAAVVETEAVAEEAAVVETEAVAEEAAVVETEAAAEEAAVVETEAAAEEAAVEETEAAAEEAAVAETEAAEEAKEPEYTIEFGEGENQFVLNAGEAVALDDLLTRLGYDPETIASAVSTNSDFFEVFTAEDGKQYVVANKAFTNEQALKLVTVDGEELNVVVKDAPHTNFISTTDGAAHNSFAEAIQWCVNKVLDFKLSLNQNITDGDSLTLDAGDKNVTVDFNGHTYTVTDAVGSADSALTVKGTGSVTLQNGSLISKAGATIVNAISSTVSQLNIKNMVVEGLNAIKNVLNIGTDGQNTTTSIVGNTSLINSSSTADDNAIKAAGSGSNTASVIVNTLGTIDGDVNIGTNAFAALVNGLYTGKLESATTNTAVYGGEYLENVIDYVAPGVNYGVLSTWKWGAPTSFAAGGNLYWAALRNSWYHPTHVGVLKAGGNVVLPKGVWATNWAGYVVDINGQPIYFNDTYYTGHRWWREKHTVKYSVVQGASSVWEKGTEDGMDYELSAKPSLVYIDGKKVSAKIDGVIATIDAKTLEALEAGTHTVAFTFNDGKTISTTLKITKDLKADWNKNSKNGIGYTMDGKVKKVLIDNVKVNADTLESYTSTGKLVTDVNIGADVLNDLKAGKHTILIVLENSSVDMSYITVK